MLYDAYDDRGDYGNRNACRSSVGWGVIILPTNDRSPDEIERLLHQLEVQRSELEAENRRLQQFHDRYVDLYESAPMGYATLDEDGYVQEINLTGARLLGAERDCLTGYPLADYVAKGEQGAFFEHVRNCLQGCREVTCELTLVARGGRPFTVQLQSIPAKRLDGEEVAYCRTAIIDITERRQMEDSIRQSRAFLQTVIDAIPDPMLVIDRDHRTVLANRTACEMAGETDPVSRCLTCHWLAHERELPCAGENECPLQRVVQIKAPATVIHTRHGADGEEIFIEVVAAPIVNQAGEVEHVIETRRDITERQRAVDALRQSEERLLHANRAKDHFLAVLSHELRTPLTPVVMGVSMLQDRPDLAPQTRETLEMVRRNVEMEAKLIDDLLDVTRIARGKIELTRRPVELCTIIRSAVEVCRSDIEARGLRLEVDMGPAAPYWVEADVSRLQQVFWNLLKNSTKFTPHGGRVAVRCRPNEAHVVVEVQDSGIGIEPEAMPRIFDAFEQAERSITRQFGGLGLGLAISKALVEMHGGTIEAHSAGPGKGATFRIRLPLTAPAGHPEMPPPTVSPIRAVRSLHILLVEDHGVTAKLMQMMLAAQGHMVETAGDVATALELAAQSPFDLLVSDLGLPDGSGHDLMRQLRQRGDMLPGIALSGYGQEEDLRRSYEAGFAAHLTKPASREAVVEAIAAVTAGMRLP